MRRMLAAASIVLCLGTADAQEPLSFTPEMFQAAQKDPQRFTLDEASVEFYAVGASMQSQDVGTKPPSMPPPPGGGGGQDPVVVLDRILNLAERIWKIIEKNRPVVDIKTSYANALPEGITHWSQLAEWQAPEGTVYGFTAKNLYGVTVIDVRFQFLRSHSGSYKGKGKYLNGVTIEPLRAEVAWGYSLGMNAEATSVANAGTSEAPLAAMTFKQKWAIDTVVKHSEGTSVYYLQGDGVFREIGGPFRTPARAAAAEARARTSKLALPGSIAWQ